MHELEQLEIASDILCEQMQSLWDIIYMLSLDDKMTEENKEFVLLLKGASIGIGYAELVLRSMNE